MARFAWLLVPLPLEGQEVDVIGSVDGGGNSENVVRHWNPPP